MSERIEMLNCIEELRAVMRELRGRAFVGNRHRDRDPLLMRANSADAMATKLLSGACDCENPPPNDGVEGTYHVSEDCPIHGPIIGFTQFTATP